MKKQVYLMKATSQLLSAESTVRQGLFNKDLLKGYLENLGKIYKEAEEDEELKGFDSTYTLMYITGTANDIGKLWKED